MDEINKYTYSDWWDGKICLFNAMVVYDEKDKNELPPRVLWDEIKPIDVPKIKKKQREIFNTGVSDKISIWKADFTKRYKGSMMTTLLLNRELKKFESIMFEPMPYSPDLQILYKEIIFSPHSLSEIKNYIDKTKINGATAEFDFIHSPNFPFQNKDIPPQIYAECCWLYVNWLKVFSNQKEHTNEPEVPQTALVIEAPSTTFGNDAPSTALGNDAPSNPFPNIFTNGYAYDMFLELQKLTVSEKTMVADYAFIFHQMKSNTLKAIHPNLSHRSFIKFLSDNKCADLDVTKLPFKNPRKKQPTFSSLLEKYKDSILGNQTQ